MGTLADDRGVAPGVRGGDVSDRQGDVANRALTPLSLGTRLGGTSALTLTFLGLIWLVAWYRGLDPAVALGLAIGTFVGLASLVGEIAIVGRSMRSFQRNGIGSTLTTFGMRLATVGLLGVWFLLLDRVDAEAFCLSYIATFFVYMVWLTWRYHREPVHYTQAKAKKYIKYEDKPNVRELIRGGVA